jgi:Transposase IS116/IS110/IS902 family
MTGKRKSRPPKADRSLRQKLPTRFRHSISPPQIIALLAGALEQEVDKRPVARWLTTHPRVGRLTALVLVIGPPERFRCGKQVASYVGLVPSEESSGIGDDRDTSARKATGASGSGHGPHGPRLAPPVSPPSHATRMTDRQGSHGPETRVCTGCGARDGTMSS